MAIVSQRGQKASRSAASLLVVLLLGAAAVVGAGGGIGSITPSSLKEWLSYIASDELQGRDTYSAGLGLAAGYIQEHLRAWGVTPAGDPGQYLQTVQRSRREDDVPFVGHGQRSATRRERLKTAKA